MTEYFQPQEDTPGAAIEAIGEDLAMFDDWMDRYEFIIELGRKLPAYPAEWQNEAHRVQGCQSQVWLAAHEDGGKLYFTGASDAAIVSGLVALVLRVYSGRTRQEILATPAQFLRDLGLIGALSTNRGNGVAAMVERIQGMARAAA
ncbi:SufE family protein [Acidocella aromatica]|jgi:cysteine desulfuration protein SufE|uniref:Cysteine desulfuration protein SufE n=1 Tax=Acidocella aromatica TaxID=1303579 RepID=A0A840V709_9PROT|nr:SufE family protein [Acidocella aromatica]MBB5371778.1 cysteine desulfuration protein SufE [Acidocella aromatica]